MAVLNFKPHTLEYEVKEGGHVDKTTGDYIKGSSKWLPYCRCDAVPNGKANTITIPDGSVQTYSYTISNLPKDCREFKYGDKIRISFYNGSETKEFTVLGFHRYQLQCKIWV